MTGCAFEIGMAKPTFCADCGLAIAVLIPITLPSASRSGPPELPGLMAASVWSMPTSDAPVLVSTVRFVPGDDPAGHAEPALERERVADRDDLVADLSGVGVAELDASARPMPSTLRTARSVDGSVPTIFAGFDVAVGERHLDLVGTLGDVVVRDDVAVVGDHEAGAGSAVARAGPVVRS